MRKPRHLPGSLLLIALLSLSPTRVAAQDPGPTPAEAPDSADYVLDPLTITATRVASPLSTVPTSVSVIQDAELRRLLATRIDDLFRTAPNVRTTGGPRRQAELPEIRGFGGERIVMRVDGTRQRFQSGHKGALFLEPSLLRRVEVVRGPSSALHGSGGLGGVVAFETLAAPDILRAEEDFGYILRPHLQSGTSEWGGALTAYGRIGSADLLASVGGRSNDDLRLGDGSTLPFSASDVTNGLAKVGWSFEDAGRVELSFDRFDEESVTPLAADADDREEHQLGRRESLRETVRLGWDANLPGHRLVDLRVVGYRNVTEVDERRLSDARAESRRVRTLGVDVTNTARFDLGTDLELALTTGVELFRDRATGRRDGEALGSFPDGTADFSAVFLQTEWTLLERLTLVPALRWERYSFTASDPENPGGSDTEVPFDLGARLRVSDGLSLFGSYSQGFNAPRLLDLYVSGLHFPGRQGIPNNFFVPNPDLGPERSESWEAGTRLRLEDLAMDGDGLWIEATLFRSDAEDFIAREVDVRGGTTRAVNIGQVEVEGLEALVRYDARRVFAGLTYGAVRQTDRVSGDPVDTAPADTWTLEAGSRFLAGALEVGYLGQFAERQDRVSDPEMETPGFGVSDVFVTFRPRTPLLRDTEWTLRMANVFDKTYRRHGTPILQPGREIRLALRWHGGF